MNYPIYRKASSLIFDTDLLGTRFTLGIAELIWAITLFWPGDTFDRPTYNIMAQHLTEHGFAIVFLLSGVTQMGIALSSQTESLVAKLFAGWNMCLWMYVVIAMYLSVSPPPAAISGEAALALASVWIWVRPFILQRGMQYARKCST